jgi:hypothetical protein
MLKRVLKTGLAVSIGLATLHGITAEAGGWTYVRPPGMWWYYGSLDGCATISKVPNPDTHPALLRCNIALTRIETLCVNPNYNDVRPGEAATQSVVWSKIKPGDLLNDKGQKNKGKANLCVSLNEVEDIDPAILCVNGNWHPIEDEYDDNGDLTAVGALTTEFLAACTTEACSDDTCTGPTTVKDTELCKCTLPSQYSAENPPQHRCADPLHPDDSCTAYQCYEVDANGDATTTPPTPCELQQ